MDVGGPLVPVVMESELLVRYPDTHVVDAWGERSLSYNPGGMFARGVYLPTIKQRNGGNDRASGLDRAGVFGINTGVSRRCARSVAADMATVGSAVR